MQRGKTQMLSKIFNRNKIALVLVAIICSTTISPAWSADKPNLPISDKEEMTLTDLRDSGLIIYQIKQQAKNIYMEATRKEVGISGKIKIKDLKFIKKANINTKSSYLPTRPEWLTFYVGTMEPLIHLFKVNANTNILVPRSTKKRFIEGIKDWRKDLKKLNGALSDIFDNISEPKNNIKIAKEAVNLYEAADRLEDSRKEAFKLIKKAKDSDDLVKLSVKPLGK